MVPLEKMIHKIFSAQFLMAVITTVGSTALVFFVADKYPDGASTVVNSYLTTWAFVIMFYFKRDREEKTKVENSNTTTTETTEKK